MEELEEVEVEVEVEEVDVKEVEEVEDMSYKGNRQQMKLQGEGQTSWEERQRVLHMDGHLILTRITAAAGLSNERWSEQTSGWTDGHRERERD